jgi:hypothetical protein
MPLFEFIDCRSCFETIRGRPFKDFFCSPHCHSDFQQAELERVKKQKEIVETVRDQWEDKYKNEDRNSHAFIKARIVEKKFFERLRKQNKDLIIDFSDKDKQKGKSKKKKKGKGKKFKVLLRSQIRKSW